MGVTMDRLEFEARLNKVYNGAVKPLNAFINERATLLFYCDKCGTEFYNKPSHMLGKDSQRHICTMPSGTIYGERLASVSAIKHRKPKKNANGKNSIDLRKQLDHLIKEGTPLPKIAKETGMNIVLIRYYKETAELN